MILDSDTALLIMNLNDSDEETGGVLGEHMPMLAVASNINGVRGSSEPDRGWNKDGMFEVAHCRLMLDYFWLENKMRGDT